MPNAVPKIYWDKDWLYDQHVVQLKTIRQIAEELGVKAKAVSHFKEKHKIATPREVRYSGASKYTCNENYFKDIDTEAKAYWLGYILADGGIEEMKCDSKRLTFCIKASDADHLQKLKEDISSSHPILIGETSIKTHGTYANATYRVASTKLCDDLISHNVLPKKTTIERMPVNISEELMVHFWRGMIDGDGCISGTKITQLHLIGSEEVVNAFAEFCKGYCPKMRAKPRAQNRNTVFCISGLNALKVIQVLYKDSTVHLDRKYSLVQALSA